jgi:hypothetical protein
MGSKLTLNIEIEQLEGGFSDGLFNIDIRYEVNNKRYGLVALRYKSIIGGIQKAMEPMFKMAPDGTQEKLDDFIKRYYHE